MKRFSLVLVTATMALQPLAARAQVFNGTPFDVEFLKFTSGSGVNGTYGVQVGPYEGKFLAGDYVERSTTTAPFALYCVDYEHYATNSTGLVNVSSLAGDLSSTRLNDYGRYQRSAYLSSLFDSWTDHQTVLASTFGGTFDQATVWSGLHAAIWNIATGPEDLGDGPWGYETSTSVARNYFLGLANDEGGSFDTSGWYVLSEADVYLSDSRSGQEFLIRTTATSVPEPSTLLLMATGLLLLFAASRRRGIVIGDA